MDSSSKQGAVPDEKGLGLGKYGGGGGSLLLQSVM